MKKRLISVLLCAVVTFSCVPTSGAAFTDISDSETAVAAAALQGLGIVSGMNETTFQPNGTLTRAQVCAMIVNAMGLSSQVSTYSRRTLFTDVASSSWYNGQVNLAYAKGVINGYGNGTFGPNDPITYGQMATILLRMLGYTTAEIGTIWPMDYTAFADDLGLSEGMTLTPNQILTRGQASLLLYRALNTNVNGSGKRYYETIQGVSATEEAIILDTNASVSGDEGLLMVYSLNGGMNYYTQANVQSDALNGVMGTVLFDNSGRVMGVIPTSSQTVDLTIGSATASTLVSASGSSYRISSDAVVIAGGESYSYRTSGYLQLDQRAGKTVRMFRDDSGAVLCLYVSGGTAASAQAIVATAGSAQSMARALDISAKTYAVTKNGTAAEDAALAQYDVAYYDAASNTLRVSDYRVTGYLTNATPSVKAASSITVAGHTFEVLECAWDTLGDFSLGDPITLLLTDDGKVAAVSRKNALQADMIGVLAQDGKSVTLVGSGIKLTGSMEYEEASLGGLVKVTAQDSDSLRCQTPANASGKLDLVQRTLGSLSLAPSCAVYEWAGSGYVCDLEGNQGAASEDFRQITWTDALSSSKISYYHTNSAGQVDVVLLNDVTGNCYTYGRMTVYADKDGINLGSGSMSAYNRAAQLTNSTGTTAKVLCVSGGSNNAFVGMALGSTNHGYERAMSIRTLNKLSVEADQFYLQDGQWYVEAKGEEYPVCSEVELYLEDVGVWKSGEDGLTFVLADGYQLTAYSDNTPGQGGQIRLICAKQAD